MTRTILLVLALALATSAGAADPGATDQKADTKADKKKAHDKQAGSKKDADPKTSAQKKYEEKRKAEAAKYSGKREVKRADGTVVDPADIVQVGKRKALFIFAVDSCDRPERCDKDLVEDTEKRFMAVCRVCASEEKCESERAAIRESRSKPSGNPCAD